MTKPPQDTISQIVDEILSEMPLEERVSLANMEKKEVSPKPSRWCPFKM